MFSETVDIVVRRIGRPDRIADVVGHVNTAIRDMAVQVLFHRDLVEDSVVVDAFPCVLPRPERLRQMRAVRIRGGAFLTHVRPGPKQAESSHYYYAASDYLAFSGDVRPGQILDLAYYVYPREFGYYAEEHRPAVWDVLHQRWQYRDFSVEGAPLVEHFYHNVPNPDFDPERPADEDNPEELIAIDEARERGYRDAVSHWLLKDWQQLIIENACSMAFSQVGDERSRASYSVFKKLETDLLRGEAHEAVST